MDFLPESVVSPPGEIGSMNLGFHRGDDSMNVIKNHGILADAIGYEKSSVVATDQIHETKVREVTKHDKGKGHLSCPVRYPWY